MQDFDLFPSNDQPSSIEIPTEEKLRVVDSDSEPEVLSHEELMSISTSTLNDLLRRDTLLRDLPDAVTLEEVNAQIALEHGQSITIYVKRFDGEEMPVVVHEKNSTVLDLKRSIRRHVTLKLLRSKVHTKISWKYIWRTYWLLFQGQKLKDNNTFLKDYGIYNKCKVMFIKRLREKNTNDNM